MRARKVLEAVNLSFWILACLAFMYYVNMMVIDQVGGWMEEEGGGKDRAIRFSKILSFFAPGVSIILFCI